jgi:protein SCO1
MAARPLRIVLLVIVAFAAGLLLARLLAPTPVVPPETERATVFPAPRVLPPLDLVDQDGQPLTTDSFLLFFGFTQCPDVCPTTLALLSSVQQRATAPDLRIVLVSVDPERDTPQRLGAYVRAFDASFTGLTGSLEEIEKFARQLGVAAVRVPRPGGDYTIDHSAALLWLDRDARLTTIFTPPFAVDALARDFTTLARP